LHAHVVEQRIRVLGPAHPHTLTSRCGLALARIAAGSAGAAANVLSAALVDAEEVPGPPTLATVVLRANLGRCLLQLERPGSAQPLLARALADCTALLGANHPDSVTLRGELARIGGNLDPGSSF